MEEPRLAPPAADAPENHIADPAPAEPRSAEPAAADTASYGPASAEPAAAGPLDADDRTKTLCEILSQLNRDVPPEESAQVVLPLLVGSLGLDTGAVLRVAGGTEAEVLAAFGHTRKRGFPYPAVDLREGIARQIAAHRRSTR